ncbi:MAG TPA: phospholipase D-like domain-containing protein [Gammaproteobacteria bacterium]
METGFYPFGGAEELTVKAIASAKQSIYLAADAITSGAVVTALIDARKRGVNILAVLDKSQAKSSAKLLAREGIQVHIDRKHAGMHNNYMIIDRQTLEIGHFGYTQTAAKKNADNVLVVWNDLEAAKPYRANWQEHWDHSDPFK